MASRWYVLQVYSGSENKVAQSIREKAEKESLTQFVEDVLVPSQEVIEVRKGKKIATDKKFYPGYILIKMEMNDSVWHMIKSISRVNGFLGTGGKPAPISQKEAEALVASVQEGSQVMRPTIIFEIGEEVKVSDGPFASFTGVVEEVDDDKGRLKVSVSIFGRATPVDLEFNQVEKV